MTIHIVEIWFTSSYRKLVKLNPHLVAAPQAGQTVTDVY
jgi:hypothetical protein